MIFIFLRQIVKHNSITQQQQQFKCGWMEGVVH
jgi:hypothetical protein